jgi:hypothetical protein
MQQSAIKGANIFPNKASPWDAETEVDIYFATKPGDPAHEDPPLAPAGQGIFTRCFLHLVKHPTPEMVHQIVDRQTPLSVVTTRSIKPVLERQVVEELQTFGPQYRQKPQIRPESELPQFVAVVTGAPTTEPDPDEGGSRLPGADDSGDGTRGSGSPAQSGSIVAASAFDANDDPGARGTTGSRQRILAQVLDAPVFASSDTRASHERNEYAEDDAWKAAQLHKFSRRVIAGWRGLLAEWPGFATISVMGADLRRVVSSRFEVVVGTDEPEPVGGATLGAVGLLPSSDSAVFGMASAVLIFGDGSGTIVPIQVGAATLVVVSLGRVVSAQQINFRQRPPDIEHDIQQYSAIAFARALDGDLQFMLEHQIDPRLAASVEYGPELDALNILRGYALAERGLFFPALLNRAFLREQVPFDLAMLAGRASARDARNADGLARFAFNGRRATPAIPQLTRGWLLLEPDNPLYRPVHAELCEHLVPALWTTFDEVGTQIAIDAALEG